MAEPLTDAAPCCARHALVTGGDCGEPTEADFAACVEMAREALRLSCEERELRLASRLEALAEYAARVTRERDEARASAARIGRESTADHAALDAATVAIVAAGAALDEGDVDVAAGIARLAADRDRWRGEALAAARMLGESSGRTSRAEREREAADRLAKAERAYRVAYEAHIDAERTACDADVHDAPQAEIDAADSAAWTSRERLDEARSALIAAGGEP